MDKENNLTRVEKPVNRIRLHPFEDRTKLEHLLGLDRPAFDLDAHRQLHYLEAYVRDSEIKCKAVAVEGHYIDRDYMEDHSVFYSRNLFQYKNSCRRMHFFSSNVPTITSEIKGLIHTGSSKGREVYIRACREFSENRYLGFCVIKPLEGCPVGRTVLRHFGPNAGNGLTRSFDCTRLYRVHFAGIELTVRGLAFQQQDVGVSACATTAIWSALQKTRDFEELGQATPAQITRLASQYHLPFGRSMPSEGLSVDQMCQAIQALGISPTLIRVTNYQTARGYIYSACKSEFAQVLILEKPDDPNQAHAVTVVGMKTALSQVGGNLIKGVLADQAAQLKSLYVHDDRFGPYLRADLIRRSASKLHLKLEYQINGKTKSEGWDLSHILIPMHGKIRLSFDQLRLIATKNIASVIETIKTYHSEKETENTQIKVETLIVRSHSYMEWLFMGEYRLSSEKLERVLSSLALSRYVGIVRLSAPYFGCIDILIDTTSTQRNVNCLKIIALKTVSNNTANLVETLSQVYDCDYVA